MPPRNPKLRQVDVMCEHGCGAAAVGVFPVHESNPLCTGAEAASNHQKWSWAALCADDGRRVALANPARAPLPRLFTPRAA